MDDVESSIFLNTLKSTISKRPLLEFAIAADASMQRLSMSSSVYSVGCRHLQSISGSSAKVETSPSNNLNFETLLDRIFFFNTQLQQLTQDINDLKNVQLSSSDQVHLFVAQNREIIEFFMVPKFCSGGSRTSSFFHISKYFCTKDVAKSSPFCFYHQRYGRDAHRCVQLCLWQGN